MEGARQRRDILTRGACRCCAAAGYHRELMKEYNFEGNREVYAEIFMECFNINVSFINSRTLLVDLSLIYASGAPWAVGIASAFFGISRFIYT